MRTGLRRLVQHLSEARRKGQAAVESAIVIPLMTFLILGVLQLAMIQHARIMTEYAAFNAARAGIVWNADRWIMENAAIISLLPTYEGLIDEHDLGNPLQMVKRIMQRALLYQVNRRLPQAVDMVRNGTNNIINSLPSNLQGNARQIRDQLLQAAETWADNTLRNAITSALGNNDLQMVQIDIINPRLGDFTLRNTEIDFDDVRKGAGWRKKTRLSIEVRYLYMMRVPFANWIIHQAWRAHRLGIRLYGSIFRGHRDASKDQIFATGTQDPQLDAHAQLDRQLAKIADDANVYLMPLTTTYTMRMQSNPYRVSVSESH